MLAERRQGMIYEKIQRSGAVSTANLVDEFGVSLETIRRDLLSMEQRGLLKRVHGGAVENSGMKAFSSLKVRNEEFLDEKRVLSETAAGFISDGDVISVDSGSTAILFSENLKKRFSELTIVTHSLDVFNALCFHKNFKVILCGGHFDKDENAFYGELALDALRKTHVRKTFVFPSAISMEFGIFDYQENLCQMQKQLIENADSVYILADSSKFEKCALLKVSEMRKDFYYITDKSLSPGLEALYKENEIHIIK